MNTIRKGIVAPDKLVHTIISNAKRSIVKKNDINMDLNSVRSSALKYYGNNLVFL